MSFFLRTFASTCGCIMCVRVCVCIYIYWLWGSPRNWLAYVILCVQCTHHICFIKLYSFRTLGTLPNIHISNIHFSPSPPLSSSWKFEWNNVHKLLLCIVISSLLPCVFMCKRKNTISWIATWKETKTNLQLRKKTREKKNSEETRRKGEWGKRCGENVLTSNTIMWKQYKRRLLQWIDSVRKLLLLSNKHVMCVCGWRVWVSIRQCSTVWQLYQTNTLLLSFRQWHREIVSRWEINRISSKLLITQAIVHDWDWEYTCNMCVHSK